MIITTRADDSFRISYGPDYDNITTMDDFQIALEVQLPFSELILSRLKTIETRAYPLPEKLLGTKIMLLESQAVSSSSLSSSLGDVILGSDESVKIVGYIIVDNIVEYNTYEQWDTDRARTCVDRSSKFEYKGDPDERRWGWNIQEAKRFDDGHPLPTAGFQRIYRSFFRIGQI